MTRRSPRSRARARAPRRAPSRDDLTSQRSVASRSNAWRAVAYSSSSGLGGGGGGGGARRAPIDRGERRAAAVGGCFGGVRSVGWSVSFGWLVDGHRAPPRNRGGRWWCLRSKAACGWAGAEELLRLGGSLVARGVGANEAASSFVPRATHTSRSSSLSVSPRRRVEHERVVGRQRDAEPALEERAERVREVPSHAAAAAAVVGVAARARGRPPLS